MADSCFASEFYNSLISSETSSHFSFSDYFLNVYDSTHDFCDTLPLLLSKGTVSVTSPFSYEAAGLDAFCLLYTHKGAGRLFSQENILPPPLENFQELLPGTLAFIDCRKAHKLICLHNIWEYTVCFVTTPISTYFHQKLTLPGNCVFHLDKNTDTFSAWEHFLKIKEDDEVHSLMRSRELIAFYTQLCLSNSQQQSGSYHVPAYIAEIKKSFDTAYQEQYSLDDLAARYHVNKFTLVRQFSRYYLDTPLQYLNKIRMDKAKELLLHTHEKIGAIGQAVGIDNTNHFIRLFKEKTGVSPSVYRRETPVL